MSTRDKIGDCENLNNIDECLKGCSSGGCDKLEVYDWLKGIPSVDNFDIFEVRLKNTRKDFYRNVNNLNIDIGDIVAVESSPGHDIGIVSLSGNLVKNQLRKLGIDYKKTELKKIYRKAKDTDVKKWQEAINDEHRLLVKTREIADSLKLNMKIGDVEFQGDKTKAIFYYIADERVDFREMIKIMAEQFKIRIEMRQIGARQEAGRIGGIGPCGRELCCTTWMSNFNSVTTNAARVQDVSLNPQKLAGQCSKLKCCLNYELSVYENLRKTFPPSNVELHTEEGTAFLKKVDTLKQMFWFNYDKETNERMICISLDRVNEIIELNKKGKKPESLLDGSISAPKAKNIDYTNVVGEDSINRFDNRKRKKRPNKNRRKNRNNNQRNENKNS